MKWQVLLFLAVFIEGFIQWLKKETFSWEKATALGCGLVAAVGLDLNVIAMAGYTTFTNDYYAWGAKVIGWLIAAIAIARGANYVHGLIDSYSK